MNVNLMSGLNRIANWLLNQRSSTRFAFTLQIICRILFSLFSLIWTPLLLSSMGRTLNGIFLSFQSIASLGGLGDLGMGGLVNVQTSRLLGQGRESELRGFLATVRALFLFLTLVGVAGFLAVSPYAFKWLKFEDVAGVGSLTSLAAVGAIAAAVLVLSSYVSSLNYGLGNILWPIVPSFILAQLGILGHWLLARQNAPLWLQYAPYVAAALLTLAMGWWFIRKSHPSHGVVRPLIYDRRKFLQLAGKSFWFYLGSVAAGIYLMTSRLFVNAGFGADMVPAYSYNFRLCELALFVINAASLVSLPKLTQWWASSNSELRERSKREALRLNKFQTLLGFAAALFYLLVNDWFIAVWLGKDIQVSLALQAIFAFYLAITGGGQLGFELAARCSDRGPRVVGVAVILAGLLNLICAWLAMKLQLLPGIAAAAVLAQSALVLSMGWYACRHMGISWWRLSLRNWLFAIVVTGIGAFLRSELPLDSWMHLGLTVGGSLVLIVGVSLGIGIRPRDLREEWAVLRVMFRSQ